MADRKIKMLCVGIGGYAHIYMKSFFERKDPDFEIVGAVDPYASSAPDYAALCERGVRFYSDMEEFYKENYADLALITTPIHFHTRHILTALDHGSNVLCEKPLSGVSADAELIENRAREVGKFVMIGYQWSYSSAIQALKADVLNGVLGKPVFLKTFILWPRKEEYFSRGSGWAGKLTANDGTVINDSVAANACAHYIHNMLFVCGEEYLAAEALNVRADLIRVNNIENFDNATIRFSLSSGGECLFIAAHSADVNINPIFEYRFENATVTYKEGGSIVARFKDGTEKDYGSPNGAGSADKAYQAIAGCRDKDFKPVCTPYTAAAHTRCIESVQKEKIYNVKKEYVRKKETLVYIDGFTDLLKRCYAEEIMLRETEEFERMVE